MLEIKNVLVVVVFIFLKHNGLCERLADSNYFYTEESITCMNFRVRLTSFASRNLRRPTGTYFKVNLEMGHLFKEEFVTRLIGQVRRISEKEQGLLGSIFKNERMLRYLNY